MRSADNDSRSDPSRPGTGPPSPASTNGVSTAGKTSGSGQGPLPTLTLPKGGGAIRGIGEKFAANPVTGTGSMSVPIATSPGRGGFGPQLSLSYDSGSGNGPFGFGWSLSMPAITRKTDKGLPQYLDAEESDVFLLSGAEDLVPVLRQDGSRYEDDSTVPDYTIHRYRPRVEGLFARIERWTRRSDGEVHWRSISKDNILTLFGKDADSRIADPENPGRIFSWLICETRDDKGNAVLYDYRSEDGTGVDLARNNERNRGDRGNPRRATNRYLKRIRYGNRAPLLNDAGHRPRFLTELQAQSAGWMFEAVFDYGEHDHDAPTPDDPGQWHFRNDPFSTYRAGYEVRTTRLCQRVLMFHHFEAEEGVGNDCLVRSTDFTYSHEQDPDNARSPVYTFLHAVTQNGYKREGVGYLKRGLPPVEFEYTQPVVQDTVEDVDPASLENLPIGVDGAAYQWIDLHGEGIPGILAEQADSWWYKRNVSPISKKPVEFTALELVATKPSLALASGAQFMDLAGDGQPDLVLLEGPTPGLFEHDGDEGWQPFRPFTSRLNRDTRDPNLRFVDLDGDGHADVLITENDAFVWHRSLAEEGFGPARRVQQVLDEEKGPRLVFADGTQSIYLGDLSGDGLTDLVRIRNRDVCYWPNLGYGRFGAKVAMDHAPNFDHSDQFNHTRIRLADIDGTGTTDIIYLHRDGVRLYFNQSGNGWSEPQVLSVFPRVDDLVNIVPTDLLGNGTACLVWSSPLPGDARRPMRYLNLMGSQKPHLLVKTVNNLGAETRVEYAPSTKFYLQDKLDGNPWITRLPFPVHVLERVETYDHISRNRFVTRYAYHHGYFDGAEREFRGFGMVEQWDTEELAALTGDGTLPVANNIDAASHVPPVHTKTWFHTGVYLGRNRISNFFAGLLNVNDIGEYYREPGLTDAQAKELLLKDTVLPDGLTVDEEREACRALKGFMLRQEVYALDDTPKVACPYTVTEQNFSIRHLQVRNGNRHAVFFTHPREAINYHYERNPDDPRIQHALTLEVDGFGNALKEVAIGYGRRQQPGSPLPVQADRDKQTRTLITYTEDGVTNAIDDFVTYPNDYRTPLHCETRTYELTGFEPENNATRFSLDEWTRNNFFLPKSATEIPYEQIADYVSKQQRLIEHTRVLYRKDDFDLTALLPLGDVEVLALPGETYKLAFTPELLAQVFQRNGQPLLPNPADVLGGQGADRGGYVVSQDLKSAGEFPNTDPNDHWWIPTGRVFLSPGSNDTAAQERAYAQSHFFLLHRVRDSFHTNAVSTESVVSYDGYDLLMLETHDALGNRVTVGERRPNGDLDPTKPGNDYRVLQPSRVMDPNRNRIQVAFDIHGMVVGTAVMGKPEETMGDTLVGFSTDLTEADVLEHLANPFIDPHAILGRATTRLVYDLFAYQRTKDHPEPQPLVVYTLARETHDVDVQVGQNTKIQHSFSYSDGFGREIQKKIQAEPGPLVEGGPVVDPRWVGSGWTIYNNKRKPVREYEPFFSATHGFKFAKIIGVSPVLFYDPVGRVLVTLHPNHTYEKVVFDPWRQTTYDVNDTIAFDPRTDPDIRGYVEKYFEAQPVGWQTWLERRGVDPDNPPPETNGQIPKRDAAVRSLAHANTPAIAYFDTLGRPYLTEVHNRFEQNGAIVDERYPTHVDLDIEGNQREVIDAKGRIVMRYDYYMAGPEENEDGGTSNRIHHASMEAGERWILNDITGNPIRSWDSRGHTFRTEYDVLRRPLKSWVRGTDASHSDPRTLNQDILFGETKYGEGQANDVQLNLRTRVFKQFDHAGFVTNEKYDFKGNLLRGSRTVANDYKKLYDWDVDTVEASWDSYSSSTTYDALNRPVTDTSPDGSVYHPTYNEANLLERVEMNLRGEATATPFVSNIDYNAKGQRELIAYDSGAQTTYDYDPDTFRLINLKTTRMSDEKKLQDLSYTYDPSGNITHIKDGVLQTIYFKNQRVEPSNDYIYDAIYRLIKATGREHLAQSGGGNPIPPTATSYNDKPRVGLWHPGDGNAMGRYLELYEYDQVGNFQKMIHRKSNAVDAGWTRKYTCNEVSQLESGKKSNRLTETNVGGTDESYSNGGDGYDPHGNMLKMPHLPDVHWDFGDQMRMSKRQRVNNEDAEGIQHEGERTYYVYDASGQRVRKATVLANGNLKDERIYLGGFEIYKNHSGKNTDLVRETLHIMDDKQRIALVETRNNINDGTGPQLIRYQFGNHLGSVLLELNQQAKPITYEEYYPYGSTSYQAKSATIKAAAKRYRYSGKERDGENGFYYYRARYYSPWLGQWVSCDPQGIDDGLNSYEFVASNPINQIDLPGTSKSWWDEAMEGVQAAREFVHEKSLAVGDAIMDLTEDFIEVTGIESEAVKEVIRTTAAVGAALTSASIEVAANLTVLAGPNILSGLNDAGEKLGTGAAKVAMGETKEGLLTMADATGLITAGEDIGEGAGMIAYGESTEEQLMGLSKVSRGVSVGAANIAAGLRIVKPKAGGVVYERTNPKTGGKYIGRSESMKNFIKRKKAHDKKQGVKHKYKVVGREKPGSKLRKLEEDFIRKGGGPQRKGGKLENKRYEINETDYRRLGGRQKKPTN